MSKCIILMRHAKSSWAYDLQDDKRPLNTRGEKDAKLVAKEFKKYNFKIDKVYSSHAKRAYDTCKILHTVTGWNFKDVTVNSKLYDFGGHNTIELIKQLPTHYSTVVLFGHNYAFTRIANLLGNQCIDKIPTSGLVKINFKCSSWNNLEKGITELIIIPKPLRDI